MLTNFSPNCDVKNHSTSKSLITAEDILGSRDFGRTSRHVPRAVTLREGAAEVRPGASCSPSTS